MSGLYGIGTDLQTLQNAAAAPKLIRASKTFTGAANLGAVGVNELFTTTGAVVTEGVWVRCTSDLVDAVDGAFFQIGFTGLAATLFDGTAATGGAIDLDTIDANTWLYNEVGSPLNSFVGVSPAYPLNYNAANGVFIPYTLDTDVNLIMTISGQAITGGTLAFYVLYRPLSSDGALTLGAGMTAI